MSGSLRQYPPKVLRPTEDAESPPSRTTFQPA
ncbi:hypothetical protein BN1708_004078 [Verticillium longisporum]|uniref:Uncharacterized protein n=1 Tax=Verticillium longisporum TaxID=100787 RepID=A0A0G4LVK1_VERLO|nr:hypothetical protein BN1708_004078 [Verticillium longisporum]